MKVLCCGFFPALQRTLEYGSFQLGTVNRARAVSLAASGKATNSARVLTALGSETLLLSFLGGPTGETVRNLVEADPIEARWVPTKTETRICQTLLANRAEACTELVENSAPLTRADWNAFIHTFSQLEHEFDLIIFSGNLPRHAPQDIYAELLSHTDGSNALLDCSGPPLLAALEQQPALVKINAEELGQTLNESGSTEDLAHELIARGARAVGITNGPYNALLATPAQTHSIEIPAIEAVNPIGSGDAVNAGTAFALTRGSSLLEAFIFGLACGTSNAMNRPPGVVKLDQIAELVPHISVK